MWFLSSEYPGGASQQSSNPCPLQKSQAEGSRFPPPPPRREIDGYSFVELDVGSERNTNDEQIRQVLFSVVASGSIASYRTSRKGFQFRRLGAGEEAARRLLTRGGGAKVDGMVVVVGDWELGSPPPCR